MKQKIRLVGGPFGGKVESGPGLGRNEIVMRGPKKMTRKQKWEWMRDTDFRYGIDRPMPQVEARYRIAMHPYSVAGNNGIPCMHPDGSIFYAYVEGSKKEWS